MPLIICYAELVSKRSVLFNAESITLLQKKCTYDNEGLNIVWVSVFWF